ncbi:MAG: hypothetical protein GYA60_09600 [Candidatus Methanofastidiosa archaeon]|nr:hypothetical protein [Candidatus Methanofastidiosa archaeon]
MTAEIAILNREAVALAADSAVTMGGGEKIFTSANKIFTLSNYEPVGIMIYGNANFMSIPWETIIKTFRKIISEDSYPSLKEYSDKFIEHLMQYSSVIDSNEQEEWVNGSIYGFYMSLKKVLDDELDRLLFENENYTYKDVKRIIERLINSSYKQWYEEPILPYFPPTIFEDLSKKYEDKVLKNMKLVFEKLPLTKSQKEKLKKIAICLFIKAPPQGIWYSGTSGVVIAGFGKDEMFPRLHSFLVEGIVDGAYLKYKEDKYIEINHQKHASLHPFAQTEMVYSFMTGVEPNLLSNIESDFNFLLEEYSNLQNQLIRETLNVDTEIINLKLKNLRKSMLNKYWTKIQHHRQIKYINPILTVISMLPKDELATVAEALVNLTSFKRRVSMDAETVGGPIDVAVISKGDGFIWIKRKHYFDTELNPRFIENCYRGLEFGKRKE